MYASVFLLLLFLGVFLSLFPIQMVLETWIHNLAGIWPCIILSYWVFLGQNYDLKLIVFRHHSCFTLTLWNFIKGRIPHQSLASQWAGELHIIPPKSFVLWSLKSVKIKLWRQSLSKFMSILLEAGIFLNATKTTLCKQLSSLSTSLGL